MENKHKQSSWQHDNNQTKATYTAAISTPCPVWAPNSLLQEKKYLILDEILIASYTWVPKALWKYFRCVLAIWSVERMVCWISVQHL